MDINHITLAPEVKLGWRAFLARSCSSYLDEARFQQAELGVQQYLINAFERTD